MPLREVIAAHRQFRARASLPANLGDGFLYRFNPVFRAVRDAYLSEGFTFSTKDFCGYFTYPLMSLDALIAKGCIPYRENFLWLERLDKECGDRFTLSDLERGELQFNYLFHESAHLLAHRAFFGKGTLGALPASAATLNRILLGEAFANTVECLASALGEGEIGLYFLRANCHFRANRAESLRIRRLGRLHGFLPVAKALFAGFFLANCLFDRLGSAEKKQVAAYSGLPLRHAAVLAGVGPELCEKFRTTTTPLHLLKLGFPACPNKLLPGRPMSVLSESSRLARQAEALLAGAVKGMDREVLG